MKSTPIFKLFQQFQISCHFPARISSEPSLIWVSPNPSDQYFPAFSDLFIAPVKVNS